MIGRNLKRKQFFCEKKENNTMITDVSQQQMFDKFSNFPDRKKSVKGCNIAKFVYRIFGQLFQQKCLRARRLNNCKNGKICR